MTVNKIYQVEVSASIPTYTLVVAGADRPIERTNSFLFATIESANEYAKKIGEACKLLETAVWHGFPKVTVKVVERILL